MGSGRVLVKDIRKVKMSLDTINFDYFISQTVKIVLKKRRSIALEKFDCCKNMGLASKIILDFSSWKSLKRERFFISTVLSVNINYEYT